jgi:DNA-binding response OmpR family regulator
LQAHDRSADGAGMSRVLVVEDEAHLAGGLSYNLEAEGHSVEVVGDGESALERLLAKKENFDAVVLDVMLPGKDGFEVATELRANKNFVPVLMLTARGRPEDVLKGFASGADDYLPKPFELAILLARLKGLLRRSEWQRAGRGAAAAHGSADAIGGAAEIGDVFTFGSKSIDFSTLQLSTSRGKIQLTLMEADLLRHLIRSGGRVVSRKSILEEVWDLKEDTDTRAIDNFVVRLRRYIEDDPAKPRHLLTVRGVGYRFLAEPEGESSATI